MLPQKRQWCRRSSNEKLARQRVQAVAELSGTQAGLLELAFTLATILACTRSGHQRRTAARQTLVFVHEVPCQRIYLFPLQLESTNVFHCHVRTGACRTLRIWTRRCVLLRSERLLPISNNTPTIRTFLFSPRSLVPLPACMASFCVFFFYRPTGRPRHTSLPLECHRNATNQTRSVSNALHSSGR